MIDTRLSDAFLVETCTHIFPVREILCDITPEYFIMACFQNVTHLVDNHILKALRSFLIKSQIDVDMMRFYITGAPARFHLTDCNTGYLHLHQWFILLDQLFYRCLQKYFLRLISASLKAGFKSFCCFSSLYFSDIP